MNSSEASRLVRRICRDLHLGPADVYELTNVARRFESLSDAAIRAEAAKIADRTTKPVVAGAVAVLAAGFTTARFTASLPAAERAAYESSLHGVGACLVDSGAIPAEEDEGAGD